MAEDTVDCAVCLENVDSSVDVAKLNCNHCYHFDCIIKWTQIKPSCPLCKLDVVHITHCGKDVTPSVSQINNIHVRAIPILSCELCDQECNLDHLDYLRPCTQNCGQHIHIQCAATRRLNAFDWMCFECSDLKERRLQEQIVRDKIEAERKRRLAARPSYSVNNTNATLIPMGGSALLSSHNTSCALQNSTAASLATINTQLHNDVWRGYMAAKNRQSASKSIVVPSAVSSAPAGIVENNNNIVNPLSQLDRLRNISSVGFNNPSHTTQNVIATITTSGTPDVTTNTTNNNTNSLNTNNNNTVTNSTTSKPTPNIHEINSEFDAFFDSFETQASSHSSNNNNNDNNTYDPFSDNNYTSNGNSNNNYNNSDRNNNNNNVSNNPHNNSKPNAAVPFKYIPIEIPKLLTRPPPKTTQNNKDKTQNKTKQNASSLASEMSKTPHCAGCGISDHKMIGCNDGCFKLAEQQAAKLALHESINAKLTSSSTSNNNTNNNTNNNNNTIDTRDLLAKLHQIKSVKKTNTKRSPTCTNQDHKIVGCSVACFSTINTVGGSKHTPTFGNKSKDNIARSSENATKIAQIMALTGGSGGPGLTHHRQYASDNTTHRFSSSSSSSQRSNTSSNSSRGSGGQKIAPPPVPAVWMGDKPVKASKTAQNTQQNNHNNSSSNIKKRPIGQISSSNNTSSNNRNTANNTKNSTNNAQKLPSPPPVKQAKGSLSEEIQIAQARDKVKRSVKMV